MVHQPTLPPVQSAVKSFGKPASRSLNTLNGDQARDTAQLLWLDWYENNIPEPTKKKFVGSGEDVCLNSL
jgi:hypothetical protein